MEQVPKYQLLVSWIKDQIEKDILAEGDKLDSENKLGSMFQMSRQTVRHAIDILEQEGLVERRRGSGNYITKPHVNRKRENTKNIALITTYVDSYIFPNIIKGIECITSKDGYTLQIALTYNQLDKERTALKQILDNNHVDGIIIEAVKSALPNPNKELYEEIIAREIPIIFVNDYIPGLPIPVAALDDEKVGYQAAKRLIEGGHTHIGGIFKADDGQGHLRYAGFIRALIENHIDIEEKSIVWIDTEDCHNFAGTATRILDRLKNCTACFCYNDEVSYELVGWCLSSHICVPEDLSIISVDNSELASMCEVPLTTIAHPMEELGITVAEQMLGMLKEGIMIKSRMFEPKIVERRSIKNIKK